MEGHVRMNLMHTRVPVYQDIMGTNCDAGIAIKDCVKMVLVNIPI